MKGRWALIAAAHGGEKTAVVGAVVDALRARGVRLGGFVQAPIDAGELRAGYEVRRLAGGPEVERVRVARTPGGAALAPTEEAFCSLVFDGAAFARADKWIEKDLSHVPVVVIDEVSKLEAAGRGHARAIERALASDKLTILCVRADQLFAVVERFKLADAVASVGAGEGSVDAFADEIAAKAT